MKKILIIEDDSIVSSVYRRLLEKRGFEVAIAADGQAGVTKMTEFAPDAVLLDLMLPKLSGVEVLKKIRSEDRFKSVPVLVFTNAYVPNMVDLARDAGANFVFCKSTLTSRQLLEALAGCLPGALTATETTFIKIPNPPKVDTLVPIAVSTERDSSSAIAVRAISEPFTNQKTGLMEPPPAPGSSPATEIVAYTPPQITPLTPTPIPLESDAAQRPTAPVLDDEQVEKIRSEFLQTFDASMTQLRYQLSEVGKANTESGQGVILEDLHRQIRSLGGNAGFAGFRPAADLSSAFEILLKELAEKPKNFNPSIQRTMANTMDILTDLVVRRIERDLLGDPAPRILVVDDEVLSRRAVTFALEKANLKPTAVGNAKEALQLAVKEPFDLIFLDVQMPELDGFELCTQIRAQLVNQKTPVIFVTSMSDFKSRVRSTLSGATDLIAKPFMFIELTVKAVASLLQSRASKLNNELRKAA